MQAMSKAFRRIWRMANIVSGGALFSSRHRRADSEPRIAPGLAGKNLIQDARGTISVEILMIKRSKSKTHVVGFSKVADDSTVDQRLHDLVAIAMAKRSLATTEHMLAGRC